MFTTNLHSVTLIQSPTVCKRIDIQDKRFPSMSEMTNKAVALTKMYCTKATTIPFYFTKPFSRYSAKFVRVTLATWSAATFCMSW